MAALVRSVHPALTLIPTICAVSRFAYNADHVSSVVGSQRLRNLWSVYRVQKEQGYAKPATRRTTSTLSGSVYRWDHFGDNRIHRQPYSRYDHGYNASN